MAARYSKAVVRLAADASTPDLPVSPREVERWRQKGLVPQPQRTFGGGGSESVYPEWAARQVAEIAGLLQAGWRLDEVAVPLFLRGYEVGEETVRSAFKSHAEHARHLIARRSNAPDTVTVAEAATKTLLRSLRGTPELTAWRERVSELAKSLGEPPTAIVESALMNLVHLLLTGEPITEEGFAELRVASGLQGLVSHMSVALGEDISADELNDVLTKLDLSEYVRLVDQFTLVEFMNARAAIVELTRFALPMAKVVASQLEIEIPDGFDSIVAGMVESTSTFGLPLVAWVLRENAAGAAEVLSALRANAPPLEAVSCLLDHLPRQYWHLLAPHNESAIEALDPDERISLFGLISDAFAADQRLAELRNILTASPTGGYPADPSQPARSPL